MTTGEKPSRHKISIVIVVFVSLCLVGLLSVSAFAINRKSSPKKQANTTTAPSLGFYMNSNNERPKVGDQFDVKLYANTGGQKVKTVSAMVSYDPAYVSLVATSAAPKADPLASPAVEGFDLTLACGPTNGCRTDNQVAFALTNTGNRLNGGNALYIGALRFKALKTGSTNVSYTPDVQQTGFLNPDASAQTTLNSRQSKNLTLTIKQ